MNELEQKVARAIDPGAFTETGRKKTARRLFAVGAAQAALKAHAEYLAERGIDLPTMLADIKKDEERGSFPTEAMLPWRLLS